MLKKIKEKIIFNYTYFPWIIFGCFLAILFFIFLPEKLNVFADFEELDEEEIEDLTEEEKAEYQEELEEEEASLREKIESSVEKKASLQNQLSLIQLQISSINNGIKKAKNDIERNGQEITEAERRIEQKNKELEDKKRELKEIFNLYYQIDREMEIAFLSSKNGFTEALNQSNYLDQTSIKIKNSFRLVEETKNQLEKEKELYHKKNEELEKKKQDLSGKIAGLDEEKGNQEYLIEKTQGKEDKYRQLLERIEKQKQELLSYDDLTETQKGELDDILKNANKPKEKYHASQSWYYSQKDKEWGHKTIGFSNSLMKDYGCAATSLAMVFTFHKENINPGKLCKKPIFYQDLIVWPSNWGDLNLVHTTAHAGFDKNLVEKQIDKNNPVIVFVRASSGKGHYVVIQGKDKNDFIVHDPLFGPNIYLGTTKKLVGSIYNSSTVVDQMIIYND